MWTRQNTPDLSGKTAIITTANTGIGFEMAKALYASGADVIIAVRDRRRGMDAVDRIRKPETRAGSSLSDQLLNLASLDQIRMPFADATATTNI